jgi:uncharacterized protein YodC (DUF2158 family)
MQTIRSTHGGTHVLYEPGDVVVLKSGGPRMTVQLQGEDANGEPFVYCIWRGVARLEDRDFPLDAIRLADR